MARDFCNKCGACCKHIRADLEAKLLYWDGAQPLSEEFESMLIPLGDGVYTCKYLQNTMCTNPKKPDICINYPSSPFAELPESCDYRGEVFMKREKIQQKIRKLKEEIIHYSVLIDTINDKKEQNQYQKIIDSHQKYIDRYKEHGSQDW